LREGRKLSRLDGAAFLIGCADFNGFYKSILVYFEQILVSVAERSTEYMDDKLKAGDFAASFADVVKIIETSRDAAFRKVNEELIRVLVLQYQIDGSIIRLFTDLISYPDASLSQLGSQGADYPDTSLLPNLQ